MLSLYDGEIVSSPLYDGERSEDIVALHRSPAVHPQGVDDVGRAVCVSGSHATLHVAQRPQQCRVSIPAATETGQVSSRQIRSRQLRSDQVRLRPGQLGSGQIGSGWVWSGGSGQGSDQRPDQGSGQVSSDRVRLGKVRSGQIRSRGWSRNYMRRSGRGES